MLIKSEVISTITRFPDQFSIDDLVEKMILLDKIEQGIDSANSGRIFSEEEVDQKIEEWLK
jgi:predicted transcriptional regulator